MLESKYVSMSTYCDFESNYDFSKYHGSEFFEDACKKELSFPEETMIHEINSGENLYQAYKQSVRGSSWKDSAKSFKNNLLHNLRELQKELRTPDKRNKNGYASKDDKGYYPLYKTGELHHFTLNERGKTRVISGNTIRDRIVRHSLNDNVLIPVLSKYLIHENCASVKSKGISKQREILEHHLRSYYNANEKSNEGYILLGDFSKFYDNILHDKVLDDIEKKVNDDYANKLTRMIFKDFEVDVSYLSDEEYEHCLEEKFNSLDYQAIPDELKTKKKFMKKSVNIGDQTSQIIGIYYPTPIDNYVKIVRGIKYYGRYMDDFYVISKSKEELISVLEGIKKIADELGIFINEKKTHIQKLSDGFTFLQTRYIMQENGYIVKKINSKRIVTMRRKLKKLAVKVRNGERDYKVVEDMFKSWINNYKDIMTKKQYDSLCDLYNELFINDFTYHYSYPAERDRKRKEQSEYARRIKSQQ